MQTVQEELRSWHESCSLMREQAQNSALTLQGIRDSTEVWRRVPIQERKLRVKTSFARKQSGSGRNVWGNAVEIWPTAGVAEQVQVLAMSLNGRDIAAAEAYDLERNRNC